MCIRDRYIGVFSEGYVTSTNSVCLGSMNVCNLIHEIFKPMLDTLKKIRRITTKYGLPTAFTPVILRERSA